MVWVLVGVRGCVPRPTGHSLVTLFSLSMSIKDRPLHWTLGKSQTYYPKHILGYGRREYLLLSCYGFRHFLDWLSWCFLGGDLCTALSPGLRSEGLESKFGRGPGPLDRRVVDWSSLCLGYKRGMCFGVPSWDTLIRESSFLWDDTTWLWSSIVVRTRTWKVIKWFWLLTTWLKVA